MPLRRIVSLLAVACLAGVIVAGCSGVAQDGESRKPAESKAAGEPGTPGPLSRTRADDLREGFEQLQAEELADFTIAWAPVGNPDAVQQLGSGDTLDAWSTIKVPIALAAVQERHGSLPEHAENDIALSLRVSDNDAARRLWNGLEQFGNPGRIVDDVLDSTGDQATSVGRDAQGNDVPFGRTAWSVADAARFAAGMPCQPYSELVLDDMEAVDPEQSWGLGVLTSAGRTGPWARDSRQGQGETSLPTPSFGDAVTFSAVAAGLPHDAMAFKGGWGISDDGYLMRQIGVIRSADGAGVGVAMTVQPTAEDHDRGAQALSDAAAWLSASLSAADMGSCGVAQSTP